MEKLTATDAIDRLSKHKLLSLDAAARASHLLNWWGIDSANLEFAALSPPLQRQIISEPMPPENVLSERYNELILIALRAEYRGVTHLYLMQCLREAGLGEYDVSAEIEHLEACPCCGYRTLSSRGDYEICDLCHWEDDGMNALDVRSGPNHMTLGQARRQFSENTSDLPLGKWARATEDTP